MSQIYTCNIVAALLSLLLMLRLSDHKLATFDSLWTDQKIFDVSYCHDALASDYITHPPVSS